MEAGEKPSISILSPRVPCTIRYCPAFKVKETVWHLAVCAINNKPMINNSGKQSFLDMRHSPYSDL